MKKPANHTICRLLVSNETHFVGATRFELATPRPPDECATGLRYAPNF